MKKYKGESPPSTVQRRELCFKVLVPALALQDGMWVGEECWNFSSLPRDWVAKRGNVLVLVSAWQVGKRQS